MTIPKDLLELEKFKLMIELFNPLADEEREQKKIRDQLKWQKCPHCGTPFKDTWGSPCPYCNGRRK